MKVCCVFYFVVGRSTTGAPGESDRCHYHPRKLPPQSGAPCVQMYKEIVDIINAA
ncbi:hypothetical protein [Nostoc sp.]